MLGNSSLWFPCQWREVAHELFVLECLCSAFRALVTKSWLCLLFCLGFFSLKIKCPSLNPSLSHNFLRDEGLLQLFQFLTNLKMLRSLKWVPLLSLTHGWVFVGVLVVEALSTFEKGSSGSSAVVFCVCWGWMHCAVWSVPPLVQNRVTPLEAGLRSVPKSLCPQFCLKETGDLVCRDGTWFLKHPEIFSRLQNFSSPGSSLGGRAVLSFLSWGGHLWKINAGELQLQQWSLNWAAMVGLCLSGCFSWQPHCNCSVQDCGWRRIAQFCFIERYIYCSSSINWASLEPRLFQLLTDFSISSQQCRETHCCYLLGWLVGFLSQHQVHCPQSHWTLW